MKELLEQELLELAKDSCYKDYHQYLEREGGANVIADLAVKLEEKGVIIPPTAEQAEEAAYEYYDNHDRATQETRQDFLAGYNYATQKP